MKHLALVIAAAFSLCGCGVYQQYKAEDLVRHDAKDPDSVQFREVKGGAEGAVCGESNSKNEFNAYTGYRKFIVREGVLAQAPDASDIGGALRDVVKQLGGSEDSFESSWTKYCTV